jgi:anti-anti-sigma factor
MGPATAKHRRDRVWPENENLHTAAVPSPRRPPAPPPRRPPAPPPHRPAAPTPLRPAIPPPLRVAFEGGDGMPLRATVSGEIDYANAFSMQVRIAMACRRRRARGLIVDLAGVKFMSSSGLGAILNLRREPACRQDGMAVSCPSGEVQGLFERTDMGQCLIVVDTVEKAKVLLLYGAAGEDLRRHPHRDTSFN